MKILNICPFYIFPPDHGGRVRVYNTNKHLSKYHKISQISFNLFRKDNKLPLKSWINKFNKNFAEHCFSTLPMMGYSFLLNKLNIPPYVYFSDIIPFFAIKEIKKRIRENDIIQVEEPFLFEIIHKLNENKKPIILAQHNVEYILAKDNNYFLDKSIFKKKILKKIFSLEKKAAERADLIFAPSKKDVNDLKKLYNISNEKIKIIPNGVDAKKYYPISNNTRKALKKRMGFENKRIILFVGGSHFPNIKAVEFIKKIALKIKDKNILFLVVGNVGDLFKDTRNIKFAGKVKDVNVYNQIADISLNPMKHGSGSNLKLFEYLASGIPTISTYFGTRGLELSNKKGLIVKETVDGFCDAIYSIFNNESLNKQLRIYSRKLIIGKYDFSTIAKKASKHYEELLYEKRISIASEPSKPKNL